MTDALSTEVAAIQAVMREDRGAYNRDEGMQARLRDLYAAQETGAAPPAKGRNERAEIQRVMRTDPRRYWRDEAMQARYRELLEEEEGEGPATDGAALVPIPTLAEWRKGGGNAAGYAAAVDLARDAADILMPLEPGEAKAVDRSVSALPEPVQRAARSVLMDRRPVSVDPMDEADMARVLTVPAYRALAREWGHEAPRRLAVLRERLLRGFERLEPAHVPAAVRWLDALPAAAMVALGRKLGKR